MAHPQPWSQPGSVTDTTLVAGHSRVCVRSCRFLWLAMTLMENELWGLNHRNHSLGWLAWPVGKPECFGRGRGPPEELCPGV